MGRLIEAARSVAAKKRAAEARKAGAYGGAAVVHGAALRKSGMMKAALAVVLAAVVVACAACVLGGCSSNAKATEAADQISIHAALGDSYDAALAAVQEKASDAKLLAVRMSSEASDEGTPEWMYLFISRVRVCAYTVFVSNGEAIAAEYAQMSFAQEEFDAIPDPSAIAVDADKAYELIKENLAADQIPQDVSVWLMTFVKEDPDPTEYAMKWVFSFNEAAAQDEESEEGEDAPVPFAYYVDAYTGDVVPVEMTTVDVESEDASASEEGSEAEGSTAAEAQALLGMDAAGQTGDASSDSSSDAAEPEASE